MPIDDGCRGFVEHSLYKALGALDITRTARRKSHQEHYRGSRESLEMAQRSECPLKSSQGLIKPGWVAWERVSDVVRPKTPNNPWSYH